MAPPRDVELLCRKLGQRGLQPTGHDTPPRLPREARLPDRLFCQKVSCGLDRHIHAYSSCRAAAEWARWDDIGVVKGFRRIRA